MKIRYSGPCTDGVIIAATGQHVRPGDTVDVPAEIAAALCDQDIWEPAEPRKTKTDKTDVEGD